MSSSSNNDKDIEDIVQLLSDHDSDPFRKNKDGDDAFSKGEPLWPRVDSAETPIQIQTFKKNAG